MKRKSESQILARRHHKRRDARIAETRLIQGILDSDEFTALANEALALSPDDAATGRPGQQSVVANMFFLALIPVYTSARKVQVELRAGRRWAHYRRQLEQRFPDDHRLRFAPVPNPTSVLRLRKKVLRPHLQRLHAIARIAAIETAARCGIGCGTGTLLEPAINDTIISDGTVLAATSKYTPGMKAWCETHQVFHDRRADPDATYNTTGGGDKVYGNKFVVTSATTGNPNEIFILDIVPVSKTKGTDSEIASLFTSLPTILDQLPGMQGLVYDKALRGRDVTKVHDLGLHPIVPVYDKSGKTTEVVHIDQQNFKLTDGTKKAIDVFAKGGHAMIRGLAAGDDHWIQLHATKITHHPNADGTPRVYTHYRIPTGSPCQPSWWGATCEIRMNPTGTDGVDRGEHLRALAPADDRYPDIYNRRQMAESLNSWIKARLPGRRARSYGQDNQHLDLLFMGIARNTMSALHHRDRNAQAPPGITAA